MSQYRVDVSKAKCQSFGRCAKLLPETFELDENRKVQLLSIEGVADEQLVRAAKGCPYRAITAKRASRYFHRRANKPRPSKAKFK